jgi:hypothetical protein
MVPRLMPQKAGQLSSQAKHGPLDWRRNLTRLSNWSRQLLCFFLHGRAGVASFFELEGGRRMEEGGGKGEGGLAEGGLLFPFFLDICIEQ